MNATATPVRRPGRSPRREVTQARVILSEWTKLRSLRSTIVSLLFAVGVILGLSALIPLVVVSHWPPPEPGAAASFDPTARALGGAFLAQIAIGVLGVLLITGEYATGMIRASFAAVPSRLPVLWAKALVYGAVTLTLTVPTTFVAFLIGQNILSRQHIEAHPGDPGVLRAIVGTALYLTVVGLLGLAIGALLRNTAGAISTLFCILFVVPIIVRFLPSSWADPINRYLPNTVGETITRTRIDPTGLAPWPAFALFCAYTALVLAAAAIALRRRDT